MTVPQRHSGVFLARITFFLLPVMPDLIRHLRPSKEREEREERDPV